MRMRSRNLEVLLSAQEIAQRCQELGEQISDDYQGEEVHIIAVLKGSFMFLADLVRNIELDVSIDFLGLSSYGSRKATSGVVRMTSDLALPIQGRHVIVVEDIIDTGLTMKYLLENMQTRKPESIAICTLLDKPSNRTADVPIDYVGFEIPDAFVIGYGLDDAEFSRHLPYIGVVKQEEE